MIDIWTKFSQRLRLPESCLLCGSDGAWICARCRDELPWNHSACTRCGIPLAGAIICGRCLNRPPPFDEALCAFRYDFPLDRLLVNLKFHARLGFARATGDLLADYVRAHRQIAPDALVPMPLHRERLRRRGFNQATEIARRLGKRLALPVLTGVCVRRRPTSAQSALSAAARQRNVRGAFAVAAPLPYRRLAIVDDVMTTGATATEAARALRAAGADTVVLWSVARA